MTTEAREGEPLQTLDGVERKLCGDDLVIADESGPVALAGVMGGGESEVSPQTTRIPIESAYFEPTGVRRTARRHGLHTESSHRFERGADPLVPRFAADRAAALIAKLAGGTVLSGAIDEFPRPIVPRRVHLRHGSVEKVLGFSVSSKEQRSILRRLGFRTIERYSDGVLVESPSFRTEMGREIDLIEEIARIHGYDSIPAALPGREPEPSPVFEGTEGAPVIDRLREAASVFGCREVVNYSFLSEEEVGSLFVAGGSQLPEARPLSISNPLSAEQAVMRTTVLSSLLANLRRNRRYQRTDLRLYEVGRVYLGSEEGLIDEDERFAAVLSGRRAPLSWATGDDDVDFYDAKGLVEASLSRAGVKVSDCSFQADADGLPWLHPRSACRVRGPGGEEMGWLGEVHPQVAERFDLPGGVFAAELRIEPMASLARLVPGYSPVPRYPPVLRDLAVVVSDEVPADKVRESLEAPLPEARDMGVQVVGATLFDVYSGPQVGEGKRSLAFAIQYQAADRTLTDAETGRVQQALIGRIERDLGGTLRA
ncbi:MAG: phenylalanine--tRNA ligase subunit beta [Myxococcota bacterium]